MTFVGSLTSSSSTSSSSGQPTLLNSSAITGLASGINTDSLVSAMVESAQVPLISTMQQRQTLLWKEGQYQEVNAALGNLQTSLSSMKLQSTFLTQQAASANSSIVTASADGLAANGTYDVSVSQLAQGATISSGSSLSTNANYGSTTLADLPGNPLGANSTSTSISLTINGQSLTFDPQTDTIDSVLADISQNTATGVSAFYDVNSGKVVMQTTATGTGAQISVSSDAANLMQGIFGLTPAPSMTSTAFSSGALGGTGGTVEINGSQVSLTAGESLSDVESAINEDTSTTGVTATFNSGSNTLSLSGTNLYSPIAVSDPSNILQLPTSATNAAQNAEYAVDGVASSSSTNSTNFNGVTLNLSGLAPSTNPVAVTVSSNTSAIVTAVTNFVQTYNQTLQTMQGLYNTQPNSSYQPLTAAQESQMTQPQIDEWNQQAQAGMLANDPLLGSAMRNLENSATAIVSGLPSSGGSSTPSSLYDIGISPINPANGITSGSTAPGVTTTGWNTYGLLQINTAQLTQAIQQNPQAVMNLFTSNPAATGDSSTPQGLAVQMYNSVVSSVSQITQEAGTPQTPLPTAPNTNTGEILLQSTAIDPNATLSTTFESDAYDTSFIGQEINALDTQAEATQNQINQEQTMWENQYANMETAIQSINSQSSEFLSMMGSGSSSSSG